MVDQQATHGASGHGEEVGTVAELERCGAVQSEVGFVNDLGDLERMTPALLSQVARREVPELPVDQGHQLLLSLRISLLPAPQEPGHVAGSFHAGLVKRVAPPRQHLQGRILPLANADRYQNFGPEAVIPGACDS